MKDVFGAGHTEKLDDKYLSVGLNAALSGERDDPIGPQLRAAAELWVGEQEVDRFLRFVLLLQNKPNLLRERPDLYFLRQIADSEIDADRVDYVIRDGLYLEHKDYHGDYAQALATVRIVEWTPSGGPGDGIHEKPRACLAFATEAEPAIARLLGKRGDYYTTYYETAEKLVVDDMICHAVANVLEAKDVEDRPSSASKQLSVAKLKRNIMMLTDESFIAAMLELKAAPECYDLLLRYQQRRFFRVIKTIDVRLEEVLRIRNAARRWVDSVEEFWKAKARTVGISLLARQFGAEEDVEPARIAFLQHFQVVVHEALTMKEAAEGKLSPEGRIKVKLELEEKILGFGFQYWTHGVFRHRKRFELAVWRRVVADGTHDAALAALAEAEFGNAADRERFDKFPPIHVTSPSHFAMFDYRDVLIQRKESPYPVEEILLYDIERPEIVAEYPIKPAAKEDRPSYPLALSAPSEIIEIFGRDALAAAFVEQLHELHWLVQLWS